MSKHLITGLPRRIASIATAGAIALGGAALMAPTAAADDLERTPPEVVERIEAQSWPRYSVDEPGPSVDIEAALHFLNDLGYITQNPGQEFTEEVEATFLAFEEGEGLDVDGVLHSQDWIKIRNMHFPGEFDSYQLGDRGHAVIGIQVLLNGKFDAGLTTDGYYDEDTEDVSVIGVHALAKPLEADMSRLPDRVGLSHQSSPARDRQTAAPHSRESSFRRILP